MQIARHNHIIASTGKAGIPLPCMLLASYLNVCHDIYCNRPSDFKGCSLASRKERKERATTAFCAILWGLLQGLF
jgi:hypothetical protein